MNGDNLVATTLKEVQDLSEKTLEDLLGKWNSMYIVTEEIKTQRLHQFLSHIKDFYLEMIYCEENRKNNYKKEVERKLKECRTLEKALNVSINCDMDCSLRPLTEVIRHLDTTLLSFEEVKNQRMEQLNSLKTRESNLCKLLGLTELHIANTIPSEGDIERLEHQIFLYEEEKMKRLESFQNHRNNIVEYIHKLEISTLLDFEKTLVDSDVVTSLTSEDLERAKQTEESYKKQFDSAKVKIEFLFEGLTKLWNRLDILEDYRLDFLEKHSGVGRKTMDSVENEIRRCEKLRRELVEPLIKKTRCQIRDICLSLCYTEEQRSKHTYDSSQCSEDLLDILEIELGKLGVVFNENSELLEIARKQRDMWERKHELEEAMKDKDRLFKNRGGQLLREEKERKTIEQALPKLTKKLGDMLLDYEERVGTPFLYYGKNLLLQLKSDIEQNCNSQQNKAAKKNESKIPDSASRVREKRKIQGILTPKSENGKRLKLAGSTLSLASSASKHSNKSLDGKHGSRSRIVLFKDQENSIASSYSLFQEEIEEKKRSITMCNSERKPLKDVNSPSIPFLSSPSQEAMPRFTFRPRANQFSASNKSAQDTRVSKKSASKIAVRTPAKSKPPFVTPKTITRSTSRIATPRHLSSNPVCTPGVSNLSKTRTFFDTPKSTTGSMQKTLSIIKPAKFKFNI